MIARRRGCRTSQWPAHRLTVPPGIAIAPVDVDAGHLNGRPTGCAPARHPVSGRGRFPSDPDRPCTLMPDISRAGPPSPIRLEPIDWWPRLCLFRIGPHVPLSARHLDDATRSDLTSYWRPARRSGRSRTQSRFENRVATARKMSSCRWGYQRYCRFADRPLRRRRAVA